MANMEDIAVLKNRLGNRRPVEEGAVDASEVADMELVVGQADLGVLP